VFPGDISEELRNEILEVFAGTKFNKISFPLSSYRRLLDQNAPEDETRSLTVGYVFKFDPEMNKFTVVLYNTVLTTIQAFENPVIEPVFTQRNGKLGTVIKLNIVPAEFLGGVEELEVSDKQ
jgi:hypothetical protein